MRAILDSELTLSDYILGLIIGLVLCWFSWRPDAIAIGIAETVGHNLIPFIISAGIAANSSAKGAKAFSGYLWATGGASVMIALSAIGMAMGNKQPSGGNVAAQRDSLIAGALGLVVSFSVISCAVLGIGWMHRRIMRQRNV
jgi:hypothetical protein